MKHPLERKLLTIAALAAVIPFAGCATKSEEPKDGLPSYSMAEVRNIQNNQLRTFVAMVPDDQVAQIRPPTLKMSLLTCDMSLGGTRAYKPEATGAYILPGSASVLLTGGIDTTELLDSFTKEYESQGWKADHDIATDVELTLHSPDGFEYFINYSPQTNSIRFDSFSPCFRPDDEVGVHEKY